MKKRMTRRHAVRGRNVIVRTGVRSHCSGDTGAGRGSRDRVDDEENEEADDETKAMRWANRSMDEKEEEDDGDFAQDEGLVRGPWKMRMRKKTNRLRSAGR